jgi:hypothetical protein
MLMPMVRRATTVDWDTRRRATTASLSTMLWDLARSGASASAGNGNKVDSVHRGARPITTIQPSGQEVRCGLGSLMHRQPLRRLMLHLRPPQAVRRNRIGGGSINWGSNRGEHGDGTKSGNSAYTRSLDLPAEALNVVGAGGRSPPPYEGRKTGEGSGGLRPPHPYASSKRTHKKKMHKKKMHKGTLSCVRLIGGWLPFAPPERRSLVAVGRSYITEAV